MHTHHVGAFGLEGVGAAGVEVRVVVALQEADVVEALGLRRRGQAANCYQTGNQDFTPPQPAAPQGEILFLLSCCRSPDTPDRAR